MRKYLYLLTIPVLLTLTTTARTHDDDEVARLEKARHAGNMPGYVMGSQSQQLDEDAKANTVNKKIAQELKKSSDAVERGEKTHSAHRAFAQDLLRQHCNSTQH